MSNDFVVELDSILENRINELSEQMKGNANKDVKIPAMKNLLMAALKNEWETTLLTSHWVIDEVDCDFRISLARLAGDEAKHFALIEERLQSLDGTINNEELNKRSPLFHYLMKQKTTFDRAVTGPYAREALAVARNQVFLEHCKDLKDLKTIELYNKIQTDEAHHHQLGRNFLASTINSKLDLEKAKTKVLEVLSVVDEIQEMVIMKMGICRLPGC
ncbi:MAG: hypothetical protein COA79_26355 [Planctomycetota bacterium]|nr:MAG: hypothetical protein COA79_26355 [Planctomycetota bacterium]